MARRALAALRPLLAQPMAVRQVALAAAVRPQLQVRAEFVAAPRRWLALVASDVEYHRIADAVLDRFSEQFDELLESDGADPVWDVIAGDGVITVKLGGLCGHCHQEEGPVRAPLIRSLI
eukprot:m.56383 g.56383  ORF g.56383 m.56383 type:complete len:120 (+) comp7002_c0_seq1:473-832(+)